MRILYYTQIKKRACGTEIFGGGTKYENEFIENLKSTGKFEIDEMRTESPINHGINPFKIFASEFKANRQIKSRGRVDYLFLSSPNIVFLLWAQFWHRIWRRKTKIVLFYLHPSWQQFRGIKRMVVRRLILRFLKKCHIIIFACKPVFLENKYIREKKKRKLLLIELGIENAKIPKVQVIPRRLCYVGRIIKTKGIKELVCALNIVKQSIPDFDMQLVGDYEHNPGYTGEVRGLIEKYNLQNNITFCGGISNDEKNKILASSRAFIFPSFVEGYGMVLPEAMQFSLPVVAWDTSVIPYTVKHEQNGLLCPFCDIHAFASAIVRILTDTDLHKKLSRGAYETYLEAPKLDEFKTRVEKFAESLNA